jgi:hypothetical protein
LRSIQNWHSVEDASDIGEGDNLTTGDDDEVGADDGLRDHGFGARTVCSWDYVDALGCTPLDGTP